MEAILKIFDRLGWSRTPPPSEDFSDNLLNQSPPWLISLAASRAGSNRRRWQYSSFRAGFGQDQRARQDGLIED